MSNPSWQLIAAMLATVASATGITINYGVLPACAEPCFTDNLHRSGCTRRQDVACLCEAQPYIEYVSDCIPVKCKDYDILNARAWAHRKCQLAGYPLEKDRYF